MGEFPFAAFFFVSLIILCCQWHSEMIVYPLLSLIKLDPYCLNTSSNPLLQIFPNTESGPIFFSIVKSYVHQRGISFPVPRKKTKVWPKSGMWKFRAWQD